MNRLRWTALVAIVGLLIFGGLAGAQDRADRGAAGATAADLAAAAVAEAEQARLAEIQANRDKTISELVGQWAPREGAYQLEMALRATSPRQLLQVSNAGSFAEVEKILLGETARTSIALPNTLGDTTQDYVFTPVTPCRIFDTRNAGGALAADTARDFYVYGTTDISSQGGNPAGCPAPKGEPRAVHINLTVVPVGDQGNVRVYPQNASTPNASVVNFKLGTNIANALTVGTYYAIGPREIQVYAAVASAHVIADIMGYYYPATTPSFMAYRTTSQAIAASTETAVIFPNEDHDTGGDFNTSTGVFTVPETGYYSLSCHLLYDGVGGASRANVYIDKGSSNFLVTFGEVPTGTVFFPRLLSGTWHFTAGDQLTCRAYSSVAANVYGSTLYETSYFSATRVR